MSAGTFYQKYRSRTFQEIIGQEHVVLTLKNAIENNRLSHAYIFSGPRGTGKTSLARILAKSLNCRTQGPSSTPCLECDLCKSITAGTSADVIEIDAASHTGVDNIRDLNDKMGFMPLECRYKIYIIDEAHMLSTGAFNALLKTLEEPPANTIFILATTEPHKIPVTIHSRCQQLHFRNLSLDEIQLHVKSVCAQESITIDEKSVTIIARNAGGCMRDALSLLNHVFSFKGNVISYEDVLFVLGSTDDSRIVQLLSDVAASNHQGVLQQLERLYADGANPSQLLMDILRVLRAALAVSAGITDSGYTDENSAQALHDLVKGLSLSRLTKLIEALAKTESDLRWFSSAELLLQLRLITWENTSEQAPVSVASAAPSSKTAPVQKQPEPTPQKQVQKNDAPTPPVVNAVATPAIPKVEPQQVKPAPTGAFSGKNWTDVISEVKAQKSALYSVLKDAYFVESTSNSVTIALKQDFQFFREKLKEDKSRDWLSDVIQKVYGQRLQVHLKGGSDDVSSSEPVTASQQAQNTALRQDSQREERINHIVALFEGTVV